MQAITTRWKGPSNVRGSRIIATAGDGWKRRVYQCEDALSIHQNHRQAAIALATELGWDGHWVGGQTKDGTVWCSPRRLDSDEDQFDIASPEEEGAERALSE